MNDDIDFELGLTAAVVVIAAVLGWAILVAAFGYKVWNERQMTHEYHAQAVELHRIADAAERTRLPSPSMLRIH